MSKPTMASPAAALEAATAALTSGRAREALAVLDAALALWPRYVPLRLKKGEALSAAAGPGAAAAHYLTLVDGTEADQWALGRAQKVLAGASLPASQSIGLLERIAALGASGTVKRQLADPILRRLAPDDQYHALRRCAPGSGVSHLEWKLAVAETERGHVDAALVALTRLHREGRASEPATTLLAELLVVAGRVTEAIEILTEAMSRAPDRPEHTRRLVAFLHRAGEYDRAGELLEAALVRWPADWMLLFRLNRTSVRPERLRSIFRVISPAGEAASAKDERYRLQFALACLHAGEIERARDLLRQPFAPPVESMARPVLRAILAREPDFWRSHSRLRDDRTLDVQVTRSEGARLNVIVPTGIAFGYLPLSMVDALFAAHGVNTIYLRDFRARAYLRGVKSLGRDEAETITALKRITASLGAPRTITMGSSLGGFAALRMGALLGATAAISFSGQTDLANVLASTQNSVWNPAFFQKLLLEREGDLEPDLVRVLKAAPHTHVFQLYGEGEAKDAVQAQRLTGLPNVTVSPVAGIQDHVLVDHLIANGTFDHMLAVFNR